MLIRGIKGNSEGVGERQHAEEESSALFSVRIPTKVEGLEFRVLGCTFHVGLEKHRESTGKLIQNWISARWTIRILRGKGSRKHQNC